MTRSKYSSPFKKAFLALKGNPEAKRLLILMAVTVFIMVGIHLLWISPKILLTHMVKEECSKKHSADSANQKACVDKVMQSKNS